MKAEATVPAVQTFWAAGFESSCHINSSGIRQDFMSATQHSHQLDGDYGRLAEFGIKTVREGIQWPKVEKCGRPDFSSLVPFIEAARRHGIQIIWDICHFGWPDRLDIFSVEFINRFAEFAWTVGRFLKAHSTEDIAVVPINEISFLSWAAGEVGWFYPYAVNRGIELKRQLVRAAIKGVDAIWSEIPSARVIHIDPVLHVVPPRDRPGLADDALAKREGQFESWDMISGRKFPELGGDPRYLDIVAVNYYHANQFEYEGQRLFWEEPRDDRRLPFSRILQEVFRRYQRPLLIGETSHFGTGRAAWILDIAKEVLDVLKLGVPVEGICIYPILDRPDWEDPDHWHNSGLWELVRDRDGSLQRVLNEEYAEAIRTAQRTLPVIGSQPAGELRKNG